jgi:predicted nucleic acid-binding protein
VLACAIAANAQFIVSGDRDLLSLKTYRGITIVSAAEAIRIITTV